MSLFGWLLLLVVLAAVGAYAATRRRPKLPGPTVPRVTEDSDSLGSLGLSEVRPAGPHAEPSEARAVSHLDRTGAPSSNAARPVASARRDEPARPRPVTASGPAVAPDTPWAEPEVAHLLASLAAHAGGRAAVVRHDGRRFAIEARTDGGSLSPVSGRAFDVDGETRLASDALGELTNLVGARARAIPLCGSVLLIGGRADAADAYLPLLTRLLPVDEAPESTEPEPADAEEDATPVPRATIIAEEQDAAREAERPLAFALVTLADAEERLMNDAPEDVAQAEAALRERLASSSDAHRVEPFGDLLFGVFLDLSPSGAATWCDRLASGAPPLFIGAVAPADGDPTDVRDAAARALHDAYDQKRTRVVEA